MRAFVKKEGTSVDEVLPFFFSQNGHLLSRIVI